METGLLSGSHSPVINKENRSEETSDLKLRIMKEVNVISPLAACFGSFLQLSRLVSIGRSAGYMKDRQCLKSWMMLEKKEDQISGVTDWSVAILYKNPQFKATVRHFHLVVTVKNGLPVMNY